MRKCVKILGVRVDMVDMREAVSMALRMATGDRMSVIVTPNVEIIMASQVDDELRNILNSSDLAVGDGVGVVWASRVLGRPLPERVSGIDLMVELLQQASKERLRVFLLGSTPGIVTATAERVRSCFEVEVVGFHHGYLSTEDERAVPDLIRGSRPHIIFVGMGSPRQELWMFRYASQLPAGVMMAVGGSFDVISGMKGRAPRSMQKLGLEWLYRLVQEPHRFRRMMALPKFAILVMLARVRQWRRDFH